MPKRKPLTEEQKSTMNAQKKLKRASEAPEVSAKRRAIEVKRVSDACLKETPEQAEERKAMEGKRVSNARQKATPEQNEKRRAAAAERITNLRKRETSKEGSIMKAADAQRKANIRSSKSQMMNLERILKGREMKLIINRVETNFNQTLLQHGLTLSHDDLQTLCNLRKQTEASKNPSAIETDSNKTKDPFIPICSISTHDSKNKPKLTEPAAQVEQQQEALIGTVITPQPPVVVQSTSVPGAATSQVILPSNKNGSKNQFLENFNLIKQVPIPMTYGQPIVKKNKQIAPFVQSSNVQEKNVEPLSKRPLLPVSKGINIPLATTSNPIALKTISSSQPNSKNLRVFSKVEIIKLPEESLKKLQNNKAHIQYLSSKKDLSPQETLLLPKLHQNQKRILATGISVPTIPGQSIQGIPFLSGVCMYVVQTNIMPPLPDIQQIPNGQVVIRQTPKKLVTLVPNTESTPSSIIENCLDSSLNLPQKNMKNLRELALNKRCDYILPDSERTNCNRHSCVAEIALLKTELDQKSIALESCNLELDNLKTELEKAKEYIANLRAQLEENTQTLCSYLAASSL